VEKKVEGKSYLCFEEVGTLRADFESNGARRVDLSQRQRRRLLPLLLQALRENGG
jgi:hypothetical protein